MSELVAELVAALVSELVGVRDWVRGLVGRWLPIRVT